MTVSIHYNLYHIRYCVICLIIFRDLTFVMKDKIWRAWSWTFARMCQINYLLGIPHMHVRNQVLTFHVTIGQCWRCYQGINVIKFLYIIFMKKLKKPKASPVGNQRWILFTTISRERQFPPFWWTYFIISDTVSNLKNWHHWIQVVHYSVT